VGDRESGRRVDEDDDGSLTEGRWYARLGQRAYYGMFLFSSQNVQNSVRPVHGRQEARRKKNSSLKVASEEPTYRVRSYSLGLIILVYIFPSPQSFILP
jgi:hypothetical protein